MFDFGDELIIESYKIPWLIWIQLLATILFIILLFGISVCTSDSAASSASTSISASTSTGRAAIAPPPNLNDPSSSQRVKEEEIQQVERNGEASGGTIIDDDQGRDESSLNDSVLQRLFKHPAHPCNYLGLAKQSFLKCLGLDTNSESRSNEKHRKQD
ncbi:Hypothetical predicted protein [Olea europaea subsp. europaea]|uniref:Uncharacterized protein n=1 Tax=Olea europaea subsp. europaea TaxID=158383 RepID=A0A8S0RNQ5_OLEEU|nr:Hypothetical predicted protein [Olea europaea subsp. europaea]